ncbi:MAG: UTRA domain-containing protein, partial [Mycobacteriales bacterium]
MKYPEDSPVAGVIARMDSIGHPPDSVIEKITARAARPDETERLALPQQSGYVLVIERTYYEGEVPIETCDITFPGDRYELTYR